MSYKAKIVFLLILLSFNCRAQSSGDLITELYQRPHQLSESQKEEWISDILANAHAAAEPGVPLPGSRHERVFNFVKRLQGQLELHQQSIVARLSNTVTGLPAVLVENGNLVRVVRNMQRWHGMFSQVAGEEFRHHIQNLALLFPMSHSLEMIFGPILGAMMPEMANLAIKITPFGSSLDIGSSHFAGAILRGAGIVSGLLISVPGFDPLCLVLSWSYLQRPRLRNYVLSPLLYLPRIIVFKGGKRLLSRIGEQPFIHHILQKKSLVRKLLSNENSSVEVMAHSMSEILIGFKTQMGHTYAYTKFLYHADGYFYLDSITADTELLRTLPQSELSHHLNLYRGGRLGVLKDTIEELFTYIRFGHLNELSQTRFYIHSIERQARHLIKVSYHAGAVRVSPHTMGIFPGKTCVESLVSLAH